jgi:ribosomal protein uS11/ribosomal protein uS13
VVRVSSFYHGRIWNS